MITGWGAEHGCSTHGREGGGDRAQPGQPQALLDAAGEQPPPQPLGVQVQQGGHPVGQPARVGGQPALAVEQVLQHVVGRVADVRVGVDQQPRPAARGQHVARVQVDDQQQLRLGVPGQAAEQLPCPARASPGSSTLRPGRVAGLELVGPGVAQLDQRAERVTGRGFVPQLAQQPGHHLVLLGLAGAMPTARCRAGRVPAAARCCGRTGRASCSRTAPRSRQARSPAASCCGVRVPPTDLEHQVPAGRVAGRGHPGHLAAGLERRPEGQRPALRPARARCPAARRSTAAFRVGAGDLGQPGGQRERATRPRCRTGPGRSGRLAGQARAAGRSPAPAPAAGAR